MSLSDLPDDILNLISIRLNGFDNCSLWMASDSILKQRLVNNVITDFDIKYTTPGTYLWPGNFLKKLSKLSRLSLVVKAMHLPINDVEIFPIPALKYMRLDFVNAAEMFKPNLCISSNNPTGPTTSSEMKYINLNDFYSNLEHLEIISPWFKTSLSIDFLGFLPQNLKTLSIPSTPLTLDRQDSTNDLNTHIEMLPQTLTSLDIKTQFLFMNEPYLDFSKLPPNLTSLSLHTRVRFDKNSYHMIPISLKRLLLRDGIYNLQKLSPFLPTGLESLTIEIDENSPTHQTFAHLTNLKDLNLSKSYHQFQPDDWITSCPPKLKKFESNNLLLTGLPSRLFNNCLTTLILYCSFGISAEFISLLPQSLTNLKISQPEMQNPFPFFSLLPKKLKSLETNFEVVEKMSLLPTSLTFLTFFCAIDPSYVDQLPPKLETLELKLSQSRMPPLPSSLTRIRVFCQEALECDIFAMLPRGLKELMIQTPDNLTDADLADLPPSLEIMSLGRTPQLTDAVIPFLPRSLTHLALARNPNFTDECIKHLPRKLVALLLNDSTKITSNSCKDLPRYLKVLSLPKCMDWDSQMLIASKNELPRYIINIHLGNQEAQQTWQKILRGQPVKTMSLSDLPDDILNLISIRLNGFDNCSLWMASDSKLRQKLVNNVITDFDIKYTIPGRYLWPGNFLKKLQKLSRLSLVVDPIVYHLPIQNIELFPIPTLKSVNLDFSNTSEIFEPNRLISSNDPTTSSNLYINLNDYYRNLEHLKIITPRLRHSLSINFLRFLPQNLKTLSLPQTYLKLDKQNPINSLNTEMEKMPRNLTKIHIRIDIQLKNEPYLDFSKLPPNLTSLSLHTRVRFDKNSYHMIPISLKRLLLRDRAYNLLELSPFLPTGLESLTIEIDENSPTHQTFAHLTNLKDLNLSKPYDYVQPDDWITSCPPKLKKFESNNLLLTGLPSRLFNNCLTTLILDSRFGINAEFISLLPQSLTNLNISQRKMENPFPFFSLLPKKLKSLETNFEVVEKMSLLPTSLTFLRFSVTSIDPSYVDQLPPKLETLELKLSQSRMPPLPSSLTSIRIFCQEALECDIFAMLPRGLKELMIQTPDNLTDADLADLPPSLEIMSLGRTPQLTDAVIPFLPRSLTHLTLARNPNFTDECIKHLPRKLVALYLNDATKITSNSCKDLPRYLNILSLPKCMDWDSDMLIASKHELPRYIINIQLGNQQAQQTWQKILRAQGASDKTY